MNLKIVTGLIALFMFAGAAGTAQDTTKTTRYKTRTLTGCLQKGEDANEYNFTAKDGGTWEIKSDNSTSTSGIQSKLLALYQTPSRTV